ncbi:zinc dependent phospholipase C family protein [Microbacterium ureisolvens]|uniref:zinc dependent phospholipase C family protein n=1 Tax=Microbacterium ureisolvens TaxID=2781186 RepID=UPI00363AC361
MVAKLAPIDSRTAFAVDGEGAIGIVDSVGVWAPSRTPLPEVVVDIAAASPTSWWAATTDAVVWRLVGSTVERAGVGVAVGAGSDGTVWALDPSGAAKQWIGDNWQARSTEPALRALSVGSAAMIGGLDANGKAWLWSIEDSAWIACKGDTPVLKSLAADADGALWAVDVTGTLWVWMDEWIQSGGQDISTVAVAGNSALWLLDDTGGVAVLPDPLASQENPTARVQAAWDAEAVFDETRSTHLWIANRAARLAGQQGGSLGLKVAALIEPDMHQKDQPFHNGVCQGLYDADFKAPYNNPNLIGIATYKSHFYDPDSGLNYEDETTPTALTEAVRFFHQAVRLARGQSGHEESSYDAGYALGLALHYFTDVTQPMHAANFTALTWPLTFHVSFESWMMARQAKLPVSDLYVPPVSDDPGGLLIAAARRSKTHMTGIRKAILPPFPLGARPLWDFTLLSTPEMGVVLSEAVTATTQFLMAWITALARPHTAIAGPLVAMAGPQQVCYLNDSDGGVDVLHYAGGWVSTNLTANPAFPSPADDPVTPLAAWAGDQHLYRSVDDHIIELWQESGPKCTDLTAITGAPQCHRESAFATLTSPSRQLFYTAVDGHLHVLWISDKWHDTDLTVITGAPGPATASALSAGGPHQNVYYIGVDGHLHCLYLDGTWRHLDLNADRSVPVPYTHTALAAADNGSGVLFVTDDGHILVRAFTPNPKTSDPTAAGNAPLASLDTPLATLTQPQSQIFYVAADTGDLIQLWKGSMWNVTDLTRLTAAPVPGPGSTLATLSKPQPQQVFYVGGDSHIHQIWYQGNWRHTDLSAL